MAIPTRPLCGAKPLRYVRAVDTDVRRTFRRARLLMRLIERRRGTVAPGLAGAA